MKLKKFASVFAATALAVGLLAGCGAGKKAEEGSKVSRVEIRLKLVLTLNYQVQLHHMVLQKQWN